MFLGGPILPLPWRWAETLNQESWPTSLSGSQISPDSNQITGILFVANTKLRGRLCDQRFVCNLAVMAVGR